MQTITRALLQTVSCAAVLTTATATQAGLIFLPSVTLLSHSIETETEAIGGGGATPFVLGPININSNDLFINSVSNTADTGFQTAQDAAQNIRGGASGTAIADGDSELDLGTATMSGDLFSRTEFTAAPDLGSGLAQSDATIRIVFRPIIDTDYTLDASLTSVIGSFAGNDVFSIRKTSQIGNPPVHLINNAIPAPIVGATGTFEAGVEYTLVLDLSNAVAGGAAQSPGEQETIGDFNLVFAPGTVFTLGGDLNGDGFVGVDDLNLVLVNWNQNPPGDSRADANGDGFVGIDDLNEVLVNWNNTFPLAASGSAIPEPATAGLLTISTLGVLNRRRRKNA